MSEAVVSPRGSARWRKGHPWIFRSDVLEHPESPGIVNVRDSRGKFLGQALLSPRSEIRLRLIESNDRPIDANWWVSKIRSCLERRRGIDANAWRLVHAEGDGLPALIVDRYDRWLVVQILSAALETQRGPILNALRSVVSPDGILFRHDTASRRLEGLDQEVELAIGTVPEQVEVREGSVLWLAAPWTGQKTGAFLDQRENRILAGSLVPEGGTALDCFSYHGSFALHLAARAEGVVALDASQTALDRGRAHADLNQRSNIEFVAGNAFEVLPEWSRAGKQFDVVVVDPPAFAKNRRHLPSAIRGYREINRRAISLLAPGGRLMSASCSHHLDRASFLEMLRRASEDSRRRITLERILTQPCDHPELLTVPETGYLKAAILRAD